MMKRVYFYLIGLVLLGISFFLDNAVTNFFLNHRVQFIDSISLFFHHIGFYVFFAFVFLILIVTDRKHHILPLVISFVLFLITTQALKIVIGRPRPFTIFGFSDLGETGINRSFPSGHSAAVASVTRFFEFKKIFLYIWLGLIVFVMFSRVYLGMHYLSDVVAGFILGYAISDTSIYFADKIKKRVH